MAKRVTPERAIQQVRFSVALTLCWPLHSTSSKNRLYAYRVLQVINALSTASVLFVSVNAGFQQLDDFVNLSKVIGMVLAMFQVICTSFICMFKHDVLQYLVEEMEVHVKVAQEHEREVFSKYIEKSHTFYKSCLLLCYGTATVFLLGPVFLPISFPIDVEYPFSVNNTAVYAILYLHQSLVTYQCTAHASIATFVALLLWYTSARFECLAMEFQRTSSVDMMVVCIKKQLRVICYAEKVADAIRFIVLCAVAGCTVILIVSGIILIVDEPIAMKMQFIAVSFTTLTEVYMYAWPADYMRDMSERFVRSAYDITWYKQSLGMQKDLLNVLVYQKPVIISISCIMPELNLEYFCSYLSNSFSIFTALRSVIASN